MAEAALVQPKQAAGLESELKRRLKPPVLIGMVAGAVLLGALVVWISELAQRSRARRAERTVRLLEAQVEELKARVVQPISMPPAA